MRLFTIAASIAAFSTAAHAGVIINNFVSSDGGFTASSTSGSNWTYVAGSYWKTGANATNYSNGTRTELASPVFTAVGGNINVSFTHFGAIEAGWDGGALAYSVNAGAPNYVGLGSFSANGYASAPSSDSGVVAYLGTPGSGNVMFSGTFGPLTSSANLGTFNAGDQVRVLFRFATDGSVVGSGWNLRDFSVDGVDAPSNGIPEPSTISLIAAGAALMFLRRRK